MTIDRSNVNRALAKAIAYKQCGNDRMANAWAVELINQLQCAAVLNSVFIKALSDESTRAARLTIKAETKVNQCYN